jgi:hypothetical protein
MSLPDRLLSSVDFPTPDERNRLTGKAPRPHPGEAVGRQRIDALDRNAFAHVPRCGDELFRIGGEICLRQYDDRFDARLDREREVSFETRRIELLVARRDDEKRIDVCRDHLQVGFFAGRHSCENARAFEHTFDRLAGGVQQ